jgi:hypothetical protein
VGAVHIIISVIFGTRADVRFTPGSDRDRDLPDDRYV